MANDEHVALLKQGVDAWNAWRDENPDIRPDLSGANLSGADLRGADLSKAHLSEANLSGANFSGAILSEANLSGANFSGAILRRASLIRAYLGGAGLGGADLSEANLSGADLRGVKLHAVKLHGAKLHTANFRGADLRGVDLSQARRRSTTIRGARMANDEHVAILKKGVEAWNAWREENPDIRPDLFRASLHEANLCGANFSGAILSEANLSGANFSGAILSEANLSGANFSGAILRRASLIRAYLGGAELGGADLSEADLSEANLSGADLRGVKLHAVKLHGAKLHTANFRGADLRGVDLSQARLFLADLSGADLREANLSGADLFPAHLCEADLRGANLNGAWFESAVLVNTDLTGADLTDCRIYGISAWGLKLEGAKQQNLVIAPDDEPQITVDNIEVAQFIYLLLHNEKIREVIDTIGKKAVLILGRFTHERKAVLDALRDELRKHNYLPILFDFDVPATRDITETVSLLARMARFIIADLTDPSSIPKELEAIVPGLAVPVQPLLEGSSRPYAMFKDYWKYEWVLPVYRYEGHEPLLRTLAEKVIAPAEGKVKALQERRRMIEAELTKPQ